MDKQGLSGFEEISLLRRTDDFSEQFSVASDPHFWIRVELPFSNTLNVTDVNFGTFDAYQMAAALGQVFSLIGARRPTEIVFKNVGTLDDPKTTAEIERLHRVVEALVLRQRRFIIARNFEIKHDKVDLVVVFKNFD